MKKVLIALLVAVVSHVSAAADGPKIPAVSLTLIKDGVMQSMMTVQAIEGQRSPVMNGQTIDYVTGCEAVTTSASSERKNVSGQLKLGTFMQLTPVTVNEDQMVLAINYSYTALNALPEVRLPDGCKVQLPDVDSFVFGSHVVLRADKQFEYRSDLNGSKYSLIIRRQGL